MQRIVIMGAIGSGKTTVAQKFSATLGIPLTSGDDLIWLPNWQRRSQSEFAASVKAVTQTPAWVFDGCYGEQVMQPVWQRADTVIWLNYSRWRAHWGVLKRTLYHLFTGKPHFNGNTESFAKVFMSRHSILYYAFTGYNEHQQAFKAAWQALEGSTVKRIELKNLREAEQLIEKLSQ